MGTWKKDRRHARESVWRACSSVTQLHESRREVAVGSTMCGPRDDDLVAGPGALGGNPEIRNQRSPLGQVADPALADHQ
jgi:hypothetical protein